MSTDAVRRHRTSGSGSVDVALADISSWMTVRGNCDGNGARLGL